MNRKVCAMMLLVACVAVSGAGAAEYIYDSSLADWYVGANPMTGVTAGTGNVEWSGNYTDRIYTVKKYGGGAVFSGDYAGATWDAPAGECIVGVEIMGAYRDDYHTASNHMGVGIFGGQDAYNTTEYLGYWSDTGYDVNNVHSYSVSVDIPYIDLVDKLELRAFWRQAGSGVVISSAGQITYVKITTQEVPAGLAEYVYDSSIADWYVGANPMTGVTAGAGNVEWSGDYTDRIYTIKKYGGGAVFLGDYAGATWDAPAGEYVIGVKIDGMYRDDYRTASNHMGVGIFGGQDAYNTTEYLRYWSDTGYDVNNRHFYSSLYVDIPYADQIDQLELRAFWRQAGGSVAITSAGYITYVKILTRAEVGPAECSEVDPQYFLPSDMNKDCYVEWADFGIFASQWQECYDPSNEQCDTPWNNQ